MDNGRTYHFRMGTMPYHHMLAIANADSSVRTTMADRKSGNLHKAVAHRRDVQDAAKGQAETMKGHNILNKMTGNVQKNVYQTKQARPTREQRENN